MYIYICIYIHIHLFISLCIYNVYIYTHVNISIFTIIYTSMPFRTWPGPSHNQCPTVPAEVGHFPCVGVGCPKSDFPWQSLGSTLLQPAQSGSDCIQKVYWFLKSFSQNQRKHMPQRQFGLSLRIWSYSALSHFQWCVVPQDRALMEPNAIPFLMTAHL